MQMRLSSLLAGNARRRGPFATRIYKFASRYVAAYEGHSHDIAVNGERELLRRLAGAAPRMVFDVGANVGDWSRAVLAELPSVARIHAFEPTRAFDDVANVGDARVTAHNVALMDYDGDVSLQGHPTDTRLTGSVGDVICAMHGPSVEIVAKACRGDAMMSALGVDHIDLLKIDTEGGEPRVLAGFGERLFADVDVIQFEYSMASVFTKFGLLDFYKLLGDAFDLGPVTARGVEFRPFHPSHETYRQPNFAAVTKRRPDIRAMLAA